MYSEMRKPLELGKKLLSGRCDNDNAKRFQLYYITSYTSFAVCSPDLIGNVAKEMSIVPLDSLSFSNNMLPYAVL
jgi:hypothetical protein